MLNAELQKMREGWIINKQGLPSKWEYLEDGRLVEIVGVKEVPILDKVEKIVEVVEKANL
jgi:hypothetical protein